MAMSLAVSCMLSQEPWNPAVGPVNPANPYLARPFGPLKNGDGTSTSASSARLSWQLSHWRGLITRGRGSIQMALVGLTMKGLNVLRNRLLGQEAEDFDDFLM